MRIYLLLFMLMSFTLTEAQNMKVVQFSELTNDLTANPLRRDSPLMVAPWVLLPLSRSQVRYGFMSPVVPSV